MTVDTLLKGYCVPSDKVCFIEYRATALTRCYSKLILPMVSSGEEALNRCFELCSMVQTHYKQKVELQQDTLH